jgi:hypothetical protein
VGRDGLPSGLTKTVLERHGWHGVAQRSTERKEGEDAAIPHCGQWLVERHEGCVERR